jgi:predicted DNA-binding transcriptional regulator YafY
MNADFHEILSQLVYFRSKAPKLCALCLLWGEKRTFKCVRIKSPALRYVPGASGPDQNRGRVFFSIGSQDEQDTCRKSPSRPRRIFIENIILNSQHHCSSYNNGALKI